MFFPRRQFLKSLAWMLGAAQVSGAEHADDAAARDANESPGSTPSSIATNKPIASNFDLIIVGGGLSGTACAISAARNGVKVALVHERSMLGGNSASEVRLYPEGNDAVQPWIRESGIHEEFHLEDRARNYVRYREGLTNSIWDLVLYEKCIGEKNLTLFLNTHMHDVRMASRPRNRIGSILAIQLGTEKTFELSAPLFVDATGDGVLGFRAGADFRWGREAKHEYGESLAPDVADEQVMGNTLFYRAVDTGKPVTFVRPEWAAQFTEEDLRFRGHTDIECGHWWIEVGAPHHSIHGNEEIRHEALRQLLGVWDHIKNSGKHPNAANYALEFVGFWPYKREARRIIGDVVLTQQQVQDPQPLDDAVANGAWGIDLHFPGGILKPDQRSYIPPHGANFEKLGTLPYGISLRSLYSRNIENLFTVGRNMSASYLGFCSSRVLSTGCVVGQAAGVAASLCRKYNATPRAIAKDHAKECQQLILRDDGHIPGVENEDPLDLARSATASASSESALEFPGEPTVPHELTCPRAQLFPVSADRIDAVSIWLTSHRNQPVELQMGLRPAPHVWDFRAKDDIAVATTKIPARYSGWIDFTFNTKVEPRKLYFVYLPAANGIFWKAIPVPRGVSHATPPGCTSAQRIDPRGTRWEQLGTGNCFPVKLSPPSKPFTADNIIRGTHRPDRWTNLWISEKEKLPAHIDLTWPSAQSFNTVVVTFDTNTGRRENDPFFRYPDCVKHYELQARTSGQWQSIASVNDNYLRRRTHHFDRINADAIRLTIHSTNGGPTARAYEVRAYDQA